MQSYVGNRIIISQGNFKCYYSQIYAVGSFYRVFVNQKFATIKPIWYTIGQCKLPSAILAVKSLKPRRRSYQLRLCYLGLLMSKLCKFKLLTIANSTKYVFFRSQKNPRQQVNKRKNLKRKEKLKRKRRKMTAAGELGVYLNSIFHKFGLFHMY